MIEIDAIEFQNWVCDRLKAVSTTARGKGPHADQNVDGWIMNTIPIQVKGSDAIGAPEVERFETTLRNLHAKEGYMVAFSFSKNAYTEAYRARNQEGLLVDILEIEETRYENPLFPKNPEIYTVLKSNIINRIWGERQSKIMTKDATEPRGGKLIYPQTWMVILAGHSVRDRPGLIPNPEVKPHDAVILVRCVSPREVAVLAPLLFLDFQPSKPYMRNSCILRIRKSTVSWFLTY